MHLAHGDRGAERLLSGAHRGPPERLGLEVTGEHKGRDAQQGGGSDEHDYFVRAVTAEDAAGIARRFAQDEAPDG